MTEKKELILNIALELFANNGFTATSTNKIAKEAGVSEALIFRHFVSKKGLLEALMKEAEIKVSELFLPILSSNEPKIVIRKTLELPFDIGTNDFDFWKLQFKLKWQKEYNHPHKAQPLLDKLTQAFTDLNYDNPELESQLLNHLLFSVATDILKGNLKNQKPYLTFLLNRYNV